MDEPYELYGPSHRWIRHDIRKLRSDPRYIPQEFVDKYGLELTRNIMVDHILLDKHITGEHLRQRPKRNRINWVIVIWGLILLLLMLIQFLLWRGARART